MWAEGQMASNVATKETTAGILRPDKPDQVESEGGKKLGDQ